MEENRLSSISKADSDRKIGDFWDSHDFTEFDRDAPALQYLSDNDWAFLDPRPRQAAQTSVLTFDVLSRFEKGKALLRATALGRPQLGRTPPPVVREVEVEIGQ